MNYSEKLKDPRWQKRRLEIFNRDQWRCQRCGSAENTLSVHHLRYKPGTEPWEFPENDLLTLCEHCHEEEYQWRAQSEQDLLDTLRIPGVFAVEIQALALSINLARTLAPKKLCDGLMDALINATYGYFDVRKAVD